MVDPFIKSYHNVIHILKHRSFLLNTGTLKYEFSGRPTDGRVDEAMVALMDEIDCTAALVGQLEMTILTGELMR